MASRAKEESDQDPLEDEVDFCRAMKSSGFKVQIPWVQPFSVPSEEFLVLDCTF